MKINFATKEAPAPKMLKNQPCGTVFCLYNEMLINQEDRDYYMVVCRNGHREYIDICDGSFRSLNDDARIMVIDCSLTIYGLKE